MYKKKRRLIAGYFKRGFGDSALFRNTKDNFIVSGGFG